MPLTRRQPSEVVDLVATLKGRPGYAFESFVSVRETGLTYRWVAESAVTANDREVIAHTGGVDGRWLPIGPFAGNAPRGDDLTNANATLSVYQGFRRVLPASTLTANRTLTLGTSGAEKWAQVTISRLDTTAFTYAIANGGSGGGTLLTIPVGTAAWADFYFDGTDWVLLRSGEHL